jgi:hypothetical protein
MFFIVCELACYMKSFERDWSFKISNSNHLTLGTVTTNKLFQVMKRFKIF